jgi:hypothetical protein
MKSSLPVAVLTPYPIPPALAGKKVTNLGDGFILRAIERELGQPFARDRVFSPRVMPDEATKQVLRGSGTIVIAGANQLNDRYTIWPGLTPEELSASPWKFVPFGIGIHGEAGFNEGMSQATKRMLELVHERIAFSSWRCPSTIDYLAAELPHLRDRFLMTGCAVGYGPALLDGQRFHAAEESVAVTATERHAFWERETALIDTAARRFPRARKYFVVHQNFSPPRRFERWRHWWPRPVPAAMADRVEGLRAYARSRGFEVLIPSDADDCMRFYEGVDVHVGTRLHAHLLFLSRNKRSWLVPVDGRSSGIAEALDFPLPPVANLDRHWDFDFERVRRRARALYPVMQRLTASLNA